MPYAAFLLANLAGALVWGTGLVLLGHLAHGTPWVRQLAYVVAGVAIAASVAGAALAHRRARPS
jgi:membrane-associated protein